MERRKLRVRKAEWGEPAWQLRETSSRGSRVCTHRERNTKWSGKHRQCFLLSFFLSSFFFLFFFFFPSSLQHPSLTIFRRIRSNRTPSYVAWPIEHAKIASVPSLSRWKKLKRWENWWLLPLEYKTNIHVYARE